MSDVWTPTETRLPLCTQAITRNFDGRGAFTCPLDAVFAGVDFDDKQVILARALTLTSREYAVIAVYTSGAGSRNPFYKQINAALRERAELERFLKATFEIERSLALLPPPPSTPGQRLMGYRGMNTLPDKFRTRGVRTFVQVSSLSTKRDRALRFATGRTPVILEVELQNCADVKHLSFFPDEEEVILPLHTRVLVEAAVFDASSGLHVVRARQLPSASPIFVHDKRQQIADTMRQAKLYLEKLVQLDPSNGSIAALRNAVHTFDDTVLRIAFVGTIKAGKSTLLNALTGHDVCPERNQPETLCVTRIRHRATGATVFVDEQGRRSTNVDAEVVIHELNESLRSERIAFFRGAVATARPIPEVAFECDLSHFTRATPFAIEMVDTPGGNEAVMSEKPQFYVNSAHVAVYIVDVTKMGTADEANLIRELRKWMFRGATNRVVIVLNKCDQWEGRSTPLEQVADDIVTKLFEADPEDETMFRGSDAMKREIRARVVTTTAKYCSLANKVKRFMVKQRSELCDKERSTLDDLAKLLFPGKAPEKRRQLLDAMSSEALASQLDEFVEDSHIQLLRSVLCDAARAASDEILTTALNEAKQSLHLLSTELVNAVGERDQLRDLVDTFATEIRFELDSIFADNISKLRDFCLPKRGFFLRIGGIAPVIETFVRLHRGKAHDAKEAMRLSTPPRLLPESIEWRRFLWSGKGTARWHAPGRVTSDGMLIVENDELARHAIHLVFVHYLRVCRDQFSSSWNEKAKLANARAHSIVVAMLRRLRTERMDLMGELNDRGSIRLIKSYFEARLPFLVPPDVLWGPDGEQLIRQSPLNPYSAESVSRFPWLRGDASPDDIANGLQECLQTYHLEIAAHVKHFAATTKALADTILEAQSCPPTVRDDIQAFAMTLEELSFIPEWTNSNNA